MSALPSACRAKLIKVLPLLGSDKPGEVVAAASAAHRILVKAGLSWDDILAAAPPPHREPLIGTWRATCAELQKHQGSLRPWEPASSAICLTSSETKQRYCLKDIAERVLKSGRPS